MFGKANSYSFEIPQAPAQPTVQTSPRKRLGKKLYIGAAIAAIAVITIVLLIPPGAATIPLNVNYLVGEKMVYNTTVAVTYQSYNTTMSTSPIIQPQSNASVSMNSTIEVISFDGEYYTLNHTMTSPTSQKPSSVWYLEKMNKTGYSTYIFNLGQQQINTNASSSSLNPYLTSLLNRSEVKVGDTWPVQLPIVNNSFIQMTGDLMMTFQGFEDLTVPAGTYRVFRVDMASHDLTMQVSLPQNVSGISLASTAKLAMDGQMYMEYGTLRQIKSSMQETVSFESAMMNYTMGMTMEMTLVEHTKP